MNKACLHIVFQGGRKTGRPLPGVQQNIALDTIHDIGLHNLHRSFFAAVRTHQRMPAISSPIVINSSLRFSWITSSTRLSLGRWIKSTIKQPMFRSMPMR